MSDEHDVQQVLARYVRAADARDGQAMEALFTPDGSVELFRRDEGELVTIGSLEDPSAIARAVTTMMRPHPPKGWSHHTTHDHIITVSDDEATIDAQFIVFNTVGPSASRDTDAKGSWGSVQPVEAGYYRSSLLRTPEGWRIQHHEVILDFIP
jgi:hypothetical protein